MVSIAQFLRREPDAQGSKCGYCSLPHGSVSDGMWLHRLACTDYQDLVDRGFRRSGHYLYKMDMKKTCCPSYTIKCDAPNIKLTRSQKKVLKTMTKFLTTEPEEEQRMVTTAEPSSTSSKGGTEERGDACAATVQPSTVAAKRRAPQPGAGADPSRPPCRKAKELRKAKKVLRATAATSAVAASGGRPNDVAAAADGVAASASCVSAGSRGATASCCKTLEELLVETVPGRDPVHRLTTALVASDPEDDVFKATQEESYALYCKYQMSVHKDDLSDCARDKWERFLVDSPLIPGTAAAGIQYGSFHRHYYLDGKLIAVGVMDILPNALSSVYVYYDPDLPHLSLGTYTALREIMYTRELHKSLPDLKWYYLGFYIHDCGKMKYKGNYAPSYLLCPERLTWMPIEVCRPLLDAHKYSRLDPSGDAVMDTGKPPSESDIGDIPILMKEGMTVIPYEMYKTEIGDDVQAELEEYQPLVGPELSRRLILVMP